MAAQDAPQDPLADIHRRGDRWMAVFIAIHSLFALALAPAHDTWRSTLVATAVAAGAFALAMWRRPGSFLTRVVAGLALQGFCALHIYQMRGMAEMHFFYFTATTAMIVYQDWRAIWPGVLAIIAQHSVFAIGHNTGWRPGGIQFFEPHHVSLLQIGFHFGIALAQVGVASFMAEALRRRTVGNALVTAQLERQQLALEASNDQLQRQAMEVEMANRQLQEQQLELEMANRQLQEQQVELEAANEELLATNAELDAQRETARTAQAAAEQANHAKSQFLATMSHELRTPLNAIGGYAQLLELGVHGSVSEEQRTALGRIVGSQRHLLGLINEVLDYARLESAAVTYDLQPTIVADVIAVVAPLLEPQRTAKGLTLEIRLPESHGRPLLPVRADREKLQQILLNLLSNAIKFTPAGGRLTITLGEEPDQAGRAVLRVADTGRGIPADKLETIFEPFVQVGRALNAPVEGTGLGLAISRDLARGMGGDLTAESVEGKGSAFTLTLPRG